MNEAPEQSRQRAHARTAGQFAVTLTPAAAVWLEASGERDKIEAVTSNPVRSEPRLPHEQSPHPPVDCYAVVPATANFVAKLALGIADNQALTQVCEAIGGRQPPAVVFPLSTALQSWSIPALEK